MPSLNSLLKIAADFFSTQDVYVVGGAVRDRLLGKPILDIDLIVNKMPLHLSAALAQKIGGTHFTLDEDRGITRIVVQGGLQVDLAERQGATLAEDLDRRDFSVNALAVPLKEWLTPKWKGAIIDRHKGVGALAQKKLLHLKADIFSEDPVRLMRAFRLAAELDFGIASNTLQLIKKNRNRIKKSSPERVRDEFLKIFLTAHSYDTLMLMEKTGLLEAVFPEARALRKTAGAYYGRGGVLKHTLESVREYEEVIQTLNNWFPKAHRKISTYLNEKKGGYARTAHLKWALLLHDLGKPKTAKMVGGRLRFFEHEHVGADMIPKLANRYRWSNDEAQSFARLVRNHMRPGNLATLTEVTDKAIHRFFRDLGDDAVAMLLVSLGDHLTYLTPREKKKRRSAHELITIKMMDRFYNQRERVMPPRILTGHDLMKELNLKPSPLIGLLLEDLMDAQTEGKIKTKQEGLDYLKKRLPELEQHGHVQP
jgi:poly(A) polymerase